MYCAKVPQDQIDVRIGGDEVVTKPSVPPDLHTLLSAKEVRTNKGSRFAAATHALRNALLGGVRPFVCMWYVNSISKARHEKNQHAAHIVMVDIISRTQ